MAAGCGDLYGNRFRVAILRSTGHSRAGGVAIGFDRLLMLLTGAASIAEVLLFPAAEEYPEAEEPGRS